MHGFGWYKKTAITTLCVHTLLDSGHDVRWLNPAQRLALKDA